MSALYPLRARPLMHAIPNPVIHSLEESPNLKAVDFTPTFKSSSLSWTPLKNHSLFRKVKVIYSFLLHLIRSLNVQYLKNYEKISLKSLK